MENLLTHMKPINFEKGWPQKTWTTSVIVRCSGVYSDTVVVVWCWEGVYSDRVTVLAPSVTPPDHHVTPTGQTFQEHCSRSLFQSINAQWIHTNTAKYTEKYLLTTSHILHNKWYVAVANTMLRYMWGRRSQHFPIKLEFHYAQANGWPAISYFRQNGDDDDSRGKNECGCCSVRPWPWRPVVQP